MRLRIFIFALLLLALILPLPTHGANPDCANYALTPRLTIGGVARVAYTLDGSGKGSRLQEYPGLNARVNSTLAEGTPLTIVRGPTCADNIQWWQVRTLTGVTGWVAEGLSNRYALEPWQILLDAARRTAGGVELIRINDRAVMRSLAAFFVPRVAGTLHDVFPAHEAALFDKSLKETLTQCPARWQREDSALDPQADIGLSSTYRSPDTTRLLVVRHLWRTVPRCDGTRTPIYGVERMSLLGLGGETLMFDLPANASWPGLPHIEAALNHILDVRWSPDNNRAIIWAQFGDRSRLLILDTSNGMLNTFGEGIYPLWMPDGEHITWLHHDNAVTTLLIARPDGSDHQTITLPPTLQYADAPIPPAWNEAGNWLLACTQKDNCSSVVPIDVAGRRTLNSLAIPIPAVGARWILSDSALLWIPSAGGTFAIQPVRGDTLVQTIKVLLASDERIEDTQPFPGGKSVLVTIRTRQGIVARFAVLNFETLTAISVSVASP